MKTINIKLFCLVIITLLAYQKAFGQPVFHGHWTAHCAIEKTRHRVKFCTLCPYDLGDTKKELMINQFNISIDDNYIYLTFGDATHKAPYHYNSNKEIIRFEHNEKKYRFKLLYINKRSIIWKNNKGRILLLERND